METLEPEEHLRLENMDQQARNRAKSIKVDCSLKYDMVRYYFVKAFIAIGCGVVLVSTTLSLALILRDDDASPKSTYQRQSDDAITFDEFLTGHFAYKTFNGSWWSETELQWENEVIDRGKTLSQVVSTFL